MNSSREITEIRKEIKAGKLSLDRIGNAYGGVIAICSFMQPVLRSNYIEASATTQNDIIYQTKELVRFIEDSMTTIDEATASLGGNLDSLTGILIEQADQEVNHE